MKSLLLTSFWKGTVSFLLVLSMLLGGILTGQHSTSINFSTTKATGFNSGNTQGEYFYLENKATESFLTAIDSDDFSYMSVTEDLNSDYAKWKIQEISDEFYRFVNKATGKSFRPESHDDVSNDPDGDNLIYQSRTNQTGQWTHWELIDSNDGYFHLKNRATEKYIRPFRDVNIQHIPTNISGNRTRWRLVPEQLTASDVKFKSIAAGAHHTLALQEDGRIVAWGNNDNGQTNIPIGLRAKAIEAGLSHSVALKHDGTVVAWGDNTHGQTDVPNGLRARAISASGDITAAITQDDRIVLWGNSAEHYGVPSDLKVKEISVAGSHLLAIKTDDSVAAFSSGDPFDYGHLDVPQNLKAKSISANWYYSTAISQDGTVIGWGKTFSTTSQDVPDGLKAKSVVRGNTHTVAIKEDDSVVAWGHNFAGQSNVPTNLKAIQVAAGVFHSVALTKDGTIVGFGANNYGQIDPPRTEVYREVNTISNIKEYIKQNPNNADIVEIATQAISSTNKVINNTTYHIHDLYLEIRELALDTIESQSTLKLNGIQNGTILNTNIQLTNGLNDVMDNSITTTSEVNKALEDSGIGSNVKSSIAFEITGNEKQTEEIVIDISKDIINAMKQKQVENIELKTPIVELGINKEDIQTNSDVRFNVRKLDNNDYNNLPSDAKSYEFSIISNGNKISTFNNHVNVSIPYELEEGVNPDLLTIMYLHPDGSIDNLAGVYNHRNKTINFRANHFSVFFIIHPHHRFDDNDHSFAKRFVNSMAARGIIKGRNEHEFQPEERITRAEFITMLVNAYRPAKIDYNNEFTDVRKDDWFAEFVATGVSEGLLLGYEDGTFRPNEFITREEIATILANLLASRKPNINPVQNTTIIETNFTDYSQIQSYATKAVATVYTYDIMSGDGVVSGRGNGLFNPNKEETRASAAVSIYKLLQFLQR